MSRMLILLFGVLAYATAPTLAQSPRPPAMAEAGTDFSISTAGNGKATFYLVGPHYFSKQQIDLGQEVQVKGEEASSAGMYLAILCLTTCQSASFYVTPASPAALIFFAHPSRVPVRQDNAISGTVLPFDRFHNLVLEPISVNFTLTADGRDQLSRRVMTANGVSWLRIRSGNVAGTVQLIATAGDLKVRRAIRQVASTPCNLRAKAQRRASSIVVETEPVRDCSGNPVPDGTIVTFTRSDATGKSTVDAPIKQAVARAQMTASPGGVISVASGVVTGNPIHLVE